MKNYTLLLLSILFFLTSCDQDIVETVATKTPIVESYLLSGQPIDSFRVSQTFSYASTDTNLVILDDLNIRMFNEEESFELVSFGNGYYQQLDKIVKSERTYQMEFDYNGQTIKAITYIPAQRQATISATEVEMEKIDFSQGFPMGGMTQTEPIDISWDNPENEYYYVVVKNIENEPEYINELLADPDNPRRQFTFITEPQIMDVYSIDTRRDIQQFGTHQVIVFRVNPEYAALYQTSDNSSTSIAESPTNIENGLGIMTGVSSDTLYLEVKKI